MTRLGIDVSNWTGDISAAKVAELKAAGVEYAIVGTQTSTNGDRPAPRQIAAFEAGGIEVPAVYVFCYWDDRDEARVRDAMTFGLPVWIDCEWVSHPMPSPTEIVNRIQDVVDITETLAGLYTGSWWWVPYTGNTQRFKTAPLWHAAYQARPESLHLPQPYGGWDRAEIWQWSSGGIAGVNADLNVSEAVPAPVPTPPLPDWLTVAGAGAEAAIALRQGRPLSSLLPEDQKTLREVVALL